MIFNVTTGVLPPLGVIFVLLIFASATVRILRWRRPNTAFTELSQRINTWWIMAAVFSMAMVLNRNVSILFFALISFLALKEYFSIIPTRRADRRVLFWAYASIPVQYGWVAMGWYGMFIVFIPVYVFLFLPLRMILIGETKDFLRAIGTVHWGVMTTVFSISHIGFMLVLPAEGNPGTGGAGLVLFLVVLTQLNDVLQYLWGKTLGRHKIVPKVSPNKTWEGFLGGFGTTVVLAWLIAPYLTPIRPGMALIAGLIIGMAGFVGDVTISALKRDLGIKDSGSLLPGHGGILDRIDSLTYTAPLFFHFVRYYYY